MASAAEQLAANLNFGALAKAEELKKRIFFTLGALLVIYRLGHLYPAARHRHPDAVASRPSSQFSRQGILGLFNMFSGGAVSRMAIFALNIMPYISASIIIQLMTTVVAEARSPQEGGRERPQGQINQYTRYLTVVLATVPVLRASLSASQALRRTWWQNPGRVLPSSPPSITLDGRHAVPDVARRADHQRAASATARRSSSSPASWRSFPPAIFGHA